MNPVDDPVVIEALAAALHNTQQRAAQKKRLPWSAELDRPYGELAEQRKDTNRAAARRIPEVLAVIGITLETAANARADKRCTQAQLAALIEANIERLAEAEHEGWMREKRESGWRYGRKRDDRRKTHPSLVLYAELSEEERQKDRVNVRRYPTLIQSAPDLVPVLQR